ncbi:hypothetical protein K7432_007791 [Basidiobolus ranarum]|uniref:Uncharacterized protein n=1 Tax=Basidiobolus ranarum TaxID=34480 RepID=A0ABR2VZM1_9FUNG
MRFTYFAVLSMVIGASFIEAGRQCNNGSKGCKACVCNEWTETSACCNGEFNGGNGNCEGIKQGANVNTFQACCNQMSGFGRCW